MAKLPPAVSDKLIAWARESNMSDVDADDMAVLVLCQVTDTAYVASQRGKPVSAAGEQIKLQSAEAEAQLYRAAKIGVPKSVTNRIEAAKLKIADIEKRGKASVPHVIPAAVLRTLSNGK